MIEILTFAVDDDIAIVKSLEKTLSDVVTLYGFTDEYQMLRALNDNVQICIIDHYLKGSTGIDVMRKVKYKLPECVFIVLSSQRDADVVINYLNEGARAYIDKNNRDAMQQVLNYVRMLLPAIKNRLLGEEIKSSERADLQAIISKYR
jgi:DNA-binding NtrC family response regulator